MSDKPSFTVAVVGLEPQHVRLIEIVFRHIQYNRFVFRLAAPDATDAADLLIAGVGHPDGRDALERARAGPTPIASIGVIAPGETARTRHAIEIGLLVRQLLPILNRVVELEGLADGAARAGRRAAASRPRVLVVDDSETVRAALSAAFARMGLSVASAGTGGEALRRLDEAPVDLAMLDVMLPDGDGLQLARAIRRETRWRSLPIVVLSSRRSAFDVIRGAASGASAYLAKPVEFPDLRRTVAEQLGRVLAPEAMPRELLHAAAR